MILFGVFQDSFLVTYNHYQSSFSNVVLGTHVGNNPHVMRGRYTTPLYDFNDYTYNLETCESYTETYIASYGATYSATYYAEIACHVRALEWI